MARRVLVIGGGAAGIFAALGAASEGARVTILEKTPRLGTKILISGGGKCNVTHDGPVEEILKAFRREEARFLRASFYAFRPERVREMLESRGLALYVREDGRVFPESGTAKDVVRVLAGYLRDAGVTVRYETPVRSLVVRDGRCVGAVTDAGVEEADASIVAAGGSSYPNSGTTGDAYRWLADVGHRIVPIRAALAPMDLSEDSVRPAWSGVAMRDVVLLGRRPGKDVARWRGDLLFTHRGVSGPTALGVSREVEEALVASHPVSLFVDAVPGARPERLHEDLADYPPARTVGRFVGEHAADRLTDGLCASAGVDPAKPVGRMAVKERNRLVDTLKRWEIGRVGRVPIEKGEVVAGGCALDEVDERTMRSRVVPGLWVAGEALDVAGPVGGYNLQAAWSTGHVAGRDAATFTE